MRQWGSFILIILILSAGIISFVTCGGGGCGGGGGPDLAFSDKFFAKTDTATILDVLDNDDAGAGTLTVTQVSDPPNGSVVINLDSTLTYTSDTAFKGYDSFSYAVNSAVGDTDSAEVDLFVHGILNVLVIISELNPPKMVTDGSGGAIIFWQDRRSDPGNIYAQRVDSNMDTLWSGGGVLVSQVGDLCGDGCVRTLEMEAVPDGSGGAIAVWGDYRNDPSNSDIYVQRINGDGTVSWTPNGVPVCTTDSMHWNKHITGDGTGGVFITWWDDRASDDWDIYAQLINSNGQAQWATDGMAIAVNTGNQSSPRIVSDGSGGAIIAWRDTGIYAQRFYSSGTALWPTGGSAEGVMLDTFGYDRFTLTSDGSGGAIVVYNKTTENIHAQRISDSGVVLWPAGGVALAMTAGSRGSLRAVSDDNGVVAGWNDWRNYPGWGNSTHIYAQKVSMSGTVLWGVDGTPVCADTRTWPGSHQLVSDGSGGAYITWDDYSYADLLESDVHAQLIASNGQAQWTTDGIDITDARYPQSTPQIVTDGSTGAIITWFDRRHSEWEDIEALDNPAIYVQHVSATGNLN